MSRASAEKLTGRQKARADKAQRRRKQLNNLKDALSVFAEGLLDQIEDDYNPMIDLRFKMTDDGRILGIVKRENGVKEEVIFNSGETFWEAMQGLSKKINNDWWQPSLPFVPDKEKDSKKDDK